MHLTMSIAHPYSLKQASTVGGASSRDCIVPFYPGLTGLWPVKMCPVMDDVTEKRVTRRHPNRILPEVKKGQKLWASKPG